MSRAADLVTLALTMLSCGAASVGAGGAPGPQWASQPVRVTVGQASYALGVVNDQGKSVWAAFTSDGAPVRDAETLKKILFVQHVYRLNFRQPDTSMRLELLDQHIRDLQTTVNMSYLSDAALLIREVAARALAEAVFAKVTGGASTGRLMAKDAALATVKGFLRDPVSYAKVVNYHTLHSALAALQRARQEIAADTRARILSYEKAQRIEQDLLAGLSTSSASQLLQAELYLQQGGRGDLVSQLRKITEAMALQLLGDVAKDFDAKPLVDTIAMGRKLIDFTPQAVPAYGRYFRDVEDARKLHAFETSEYFKLELQPSIEHWCAGRREGAHPALEAWNAFAAAVKANDYGAAARALCDNWRNTRLVDPSSAEAMRDLREKTLEVRLVQAAVPLQLGKVVQDDPDHFIIEGTWQFDSLDAVRSFLKSHGFAHLRDRADAMTADEIQRIHDNMKGPYPFRFHRLQGKWYFLPRGW